jgi:hypothetical protein
MSRLLKCLLLLVPGLAFSTALSAQQLWREGGNASGLALSGQDQAEARLYGRYTSGGFKTPSEGASLWGTGAAAAAESHFKDLVLAGRFSFDLVSGKDMYGSMFTRPGYYPVDVLEFTPGQKVKQTYGIGGSLAWMNGSRWIPGASLRFEGVNYAKRKDIRHTTYRQEVEVVPSLLYRGDGWAAGATFRWDKTSEFIQAEQIGSATSDSYYAFLDKGLRYGAYQVWDGSGIHLKEAGVDRLPVKEITYGAGLQASLGDFLYGQAEYRVSRGEAGEKGYTWFRFPGRALDALLAGSFRGGDGRHTILLHYGWQRKENWETVLEKVTAGGVTTPVEYGSNPVFRQEILSAEPSYRFEAESGWEVSACAEVTFNHRLSTVLYPFGDDDSVTHLTSRIETKIPWGRFTLGAGLLLRNVLGSHTHTLTNTDESLGVSTEPFRLDDFYEKELEAADAARIGGKLSLRYSIPLRGGNPLFLEAGCDFVHAFRVERLEGRNRQVTQLTIGYLF